MTRLQYIEDGIVQSNNKVTVDTLVMVLHSPKIAKQASAGQFIMLSCSKTGHSPLLRRPLSILDINGDSVSLLYKIVGVGTDIMADITQGETVSLLGPLGKGFTVAKTKHHCLVGGGIGIAPLLFLARMIKQSDPLSTITFLEGARNRQELLIVDTLQSYGEVLVSTDDGSEGHHGFVTGLLEDLGDEEMSVYTCGPIPMMMGVAAISKKKGWSCQVAMETHMACGMGACLGCSYPRAGTHQGVEKYVHVCKDGPVFDAEDLWI